MSSLSTQSSGKNVRMMKYVAVLLSSFLLVEPNLVSPSSTTWANVFITAPRPTLTRYGDSQTDRIDQEMFGIYFLNDHGFTSQLIIHNQRIDVAVTVTPVLLIDNGRREIKLNPVKIGANRSRTIDIARALDDRHEKDVKFGGVVLRYAFPETGPIDATITINHSMDKLSLMSPIMGRAEFMSNTQEGVFWAPDKQTEIFVGLQNTTFEQRHVTPTVFAEGRQVSLRRTTLAPHETIFLNLNNLMNGQGKAPANSMVGAIRLVNDGAAGDVMAEGGLINHAKGFSKRISFMDTSLHFYDTTLRANFLLLGEPPLELGFPPQVSFRSVCVMRNTSGVSIRVRPAVKYLDQDNVRKATLQEVVLGSGAVLALDLFEQQNKGSIPPTFHMGTLELECDGDVGSLIAELTNLDTGGGYVLGSSFFGHPSRGIGGTFWRIDADWQSVITLTNASPTEDQVNIQLSYEGGSYRLPPIRVAGGDIATVNLKELQRKGIPGIDGSPLPSFAISGSFFVKGSNELGSAISMERLIFNTQTSECVVIDGTNDHFVTSISGQAGEPSSPVLQDTEATRCPGFCAPDNDCSLE